MPLPILTDPAFAPDVAAVLRDIKFILDNRVHGLSGASEQVVIRGDLPSTQLALLSGSATLADVITAVNALTAAYNAFAAAATTGTAV